MDELAVFERALDLNDPDERAAHLDEACGQNVRLRSRVEALLRSHEQAGSFLQGAATGPAITLDQAPLERPGTQIGPYKLLQEIGHGGMGVVYMAQQHDPVERRVALKIIKPGMDTRQVIARFEAERQALAMMDHPNIAKVLDAGTTDSGRPYFVMELVKGVPITQYCDEHHLTPRQRLEMLLPVCQAIQHAHQKGIIQRDIKPSNVLVAEYDEKPVPKVIDFGVAKAISQSSGACGVTDAGDICGWSSTSDAPKAAFVIRGNGPLTALPKVRGEVLSEAFALNDANVAGYSSTNYVTDKAAYWDARRATQLSAKKWVLNYVRAINTSGAMVGTGQYSPDFNPRAYLRQ